MKDYYKALQVTIESSPDEIKTSYRRLALKYHPDKSYHPQSEAIFKMISEAYTVLGNPEQKKEYDIEYRRIKSQTSQSENKSKPTPNVYKLSIFDKARIISGVILKRVFAYILQIGIVILAIWGIAKVFQLMSNDSRKAESKMRPQSGEITPTPTSELPPPPKKLDEIDPYLTWETPVLKTGRTPDCFNYKPRYNKSIDNKLIVSVGSHADVVLKVINVQTNRCIRCVYIRSGDKFTIRNIPEGIYYTKIAYGSDWKQKNIDGKCIGKFTSNALYKRGEELLDYNLEYSDDGYQIPSFSLSLDVIYTEGHTYETNTINEDDFNQ